MSLHVVEQANIVATRHHEGQIYGESLPFIEHPRRAARIAQRLGYHAYLQAACLLHDTVEDTDYTLEELRADFDRYSPFIGDTVEAVSYLPEHDERGVDKIEMARAHIGGHVAKLCDVTSHIVLLGEYGPKPGKTFEQILAKNLRNYLRLSVDVPTPKEIEKAIRESKAA